MSVVRFAVDPETRTYLAALVQVGLLACILSWNGEGAVPSGAAIRERISFRGLIPAARSIPVTKDHAHCGDGHQVEDESLLISAEGAVQNAVVYVEGA